MTTEEALNLQAVEIKVPTFLLADDPFGANKPELYVQYIYSPPYLSLILVLCDYNKLVPNEDIDKRPQKEYVFTLDAFPMVKMTFRLIMFQNNIEQTAGEMAPVITVEEFLDNAWEFYRKFLEAETYKSLLEEIEKIK